MADILDKEVVTECRSTEEMVAGLEEVNRRRASEEMVTFSTDVTALYPNLKAKKVAKEIAGAYLEIDLEIEVDIHQLGLYLLLVLGKEEVRKQGLTKVCPTRKATAGAECGITTKEVMGGPECESRHKPAERNPTTGQRKKMISLAIEDGILAAMQNHVYTFAGQTYLQTDGGPIGLELSGALARTYMQLWDRKLLLALQKATAHLVWDLYLYLRYVDDGNYATDTMPPGARLVRGKVRVIEDKVEQDLDIPGDLRTARIGR